MGTNELLPGTLDMLVLKALSRGANHGYAIAQHIHQVTSDALKIGEGSLYPALQRLLVGELVTAEWGLSENNRKARIYKITVKGRKRLAEERKSFDSIVGAIARVMEA